jgi:glutathione S-transferase
MSGLRVFFDLLSQPSRAVYIFLKVNKIPFEAKQVALRKGEHLSEEYGKINPFHLVPAIDDNGFKLTESVAILKYFADKYQTPDHWYPKDLQRRAKVDCFMAWQHLNLRMYGSMVFQSQLIEPMRTGKPVNKKRVANFQSELETVLNKMEQIFLHEDPYLCGSDISIGDLLGICELWQPMTVEHDVFAGRPKLKAWATRVEEKLQPHFDEAHKYIVKLKELYKADYKAKL